MLFLTINIDFRAQIKDFKFATQKKERNSYSNAILERLFLKFFATFNISIDRSPIKNDLKNANMKENLQIYEELTKSEIK